jgi:hypothetical protein
MKGMLIFYAGLLIIKRLNINIIFFYIILYIKNTFLPGDQRNLNMLMKGIFLLCIIFKTSKIFMRQNSFYAFKFSF